MSLKRSFLVLLLLGALAIDARAAGRALLIGINDYTASRLKPQPGRTPAPGRDWPNLLGPVTDVAMLEEMLRDTYGFQLQDVVTLTNQDATHDAILKALEDLVLRTAKGDVVFVYYAGHGSRVENSLSDEPDKLDESIIPADSRLGGDDIRDKQLRRFFNRILDRGARLTVMLDSCFSGSGARGLPTGAQSRSVEKDPRDVKDGSDYGPRPENRGALVLAASEDSDGAWNMSDDKGRFHGAFSWAWIRALRDSWPGESAEETFLRAYARMRVEMPFQTPVIAGERARLDPFLGVRKDRRDDRIVVAVESIRSDGTVLLQGGWASGLAEDTKLTHGLVVSKLRGLTRSEARVEQGRAMPKEVQPGALLEVTGWSAPETRPLRVWMPRTSTPIQSLRARAAEFAAAARRRKIRWIDDPIEVTPMHLLRQHGAGWELLRSDGTSERVSSDAAALKAIEKIESGSSLFVQFPMPASLVDGMQIHQAIERTEEPGDADYILAGRFAGKQLAYAWLRPLVNQSDRWKSGLPLRSDWVACDSPALRNMLLRIRRIHAWHVLESPPNNGFPYRLAIRRSGGAFVKERAPLNGDEVCELILRAPSPRSVQQRYVYAFVIDSHGESILLFPSSGSVENRFPLSPSTLPPEIRLDAFAVTEPYGVDTYFLLSTNEPLPNPWVLQWDGIRTREPSSSPLEELLALTSSGERSRGRTPPTWSIERVVFESVPPRKSAAMRSPVFAPAATASDGQERVQLVAQLGHSAPIHAVAYAPQGDHVATASQDATVKLWVAATGHELRTFAGHTDQVMSVAFSPDGRFLVTGSRDKTAKLWDVATGEEIRSFPHGNGWILATAFSPDGRLVLTGGWDSVITAWNVETGEPVGSFPGHEKGVSSIAVSPDGQTLLAGSSDHTARLWDLASGTLKRTLTGHTDTVSAVAFSPESRFAATASWDRTLKLWDVESGAEIRTLTLHIKEVTSVAFSPTGKHLLSGSRDLSAVLWNVQTGKALGAATGHLDWISSVAFSAEDRYFVTASHDKSVKRWDSTGTTKPLDLASRTSAVRAAAWSPDGRSFATAGDDGITTLWDLAAGQPVRTLTGHDHWVMSLAFSPDGRSIATASWDTSVKLWDVQTGAMLRTFQGHSAAVTSALFSPDGRLLVTSAWDKSAKVWDVATGAELQSFASNEKPVESAAFSRDGNYLATGWGAGARIWDTATWTLVRVIGPHTIDFEMPAVAFSPDGRIVLTGSSDGTVKLWNAKSGAELRTLAAHTAPIRSAAFSADGRLLLTAGSDRTAKLWNANTGAEIRTFAGHSGAVNAAAFSRDEKFILTASADGTARIWESGSDRALLTLVAFADAGWAVVDRDGRFDASNGGDVDGLHWVAGDEVIALHQLQSRYYDPFLLAKVLGTSREELKDVDALDRIARGPAVSVDGPADGSTKITITVRNRGGGIGPVSVLVNRKEFAGDVCGTRDGSSKEAVTCVVDLAAASILAGEENTIEVLAWNAEESHPSRGARRFVAPAGPAIKHAPELYAIVVGISEYASPSINLSYAAEDARDMAKTIELGARRLFGDGRVHVTRLATGDPEQPTKTNLKATFENVARRARPEDVLFVYLAGHGTAIADDYVFPTRDATTLALRDAKTRERDAVTGKELTEWARNIRALKQVMILDTCAAGAVAAHFERGEQSSIVRAMERLSSRTGVHVLMGSAADAASYESHGLGQGLLTWAVLQGIKGAALRDDEFIDVSMLFQHAADQVPLLAKQTEPVQRPQIAAPRGLSFDIGRLIGDDKKFVPIAQERPIMLRPMLLNADTKIDDLELTAAFRTALREHSASLRQYVFVDGDLPGGVRVAGTYKVDGAKVQVSLVLHKDKEKMAAMEIDGTAADVSSLTQKLETAIRGAVLNRSSAPADRR